MTTLAAYLTALDNDALEALLDNLADGTVVAVPVEVSPLDLYDAALTERYAPHRADRVATLPLVADPAPANVADLVLFGVTR